MFHERDYSKKSSFDKQSNRMLKVFLRVFQIDAAGRAQRGHDPTLGLRSVDQRIQRHLVDNARIS